jgi:hypothetical protein
MGDARVPGVLPSIAMSLLLTFRKLGHDCTLRIDPPGLHHLADFLQTAALTSSAACRADEPADLIWHGPDDGPWSILLHGAPWKESIASSREMFLQSDHLLDHLAIGASGDAVFLHAGGVVAPGGRGLLVCGKSGAGKTSLVTACILRGWEWLGDELLAFYPQDWFRMHGVKRNFNLKQRSFAHFPATADLPDTLQVEMPDSRRELRFFNPDSLAAGRFRESAHLDAIVFPEFTAEGPGLLEPLPQHTVAARLAVEAMSRSERTFAWLAAQARATPGYRLTYRDPHEAAARLADLARPHLQP